MNAVMLVTLYTGAPEVKRLHQDQQRKLRSCEFTMPLVERGAQNELHGLNNVRRPAESGSLASVPIKNESLPNTTDREGGRREGGGRVQDTFGSGSMTRC